MIHYRTILVLVCAPVFGQQYTISTIAGDGTAGAFLNYPTSVAVDQEGDVYVADWSGFIRKIWVKDGATVPVFSFDIDFTAASRNVEAYMVIPQRKNRSLIILEKRSPRALVPSAKIRTFTWVAIGRFYLEAIGQDFNRFETRWVISALLRAFSWPFSLFSLRPWVSRYVLAA